MNALHDMNPRKGKEQEATLALIQTNNNQLYIYVSQNGHFHKSLLVLNNEPR